MSADEALPIEALRTEGILWAINAAVFHPRGFALAVNVADDGTVDGLALLGDGSEPWCFADHDADEPFAAFEALLARHRSAP